MTGMKPGRWWRVLLADGSVWSETSDEAQAREQLAEQPGAALERLYQAEAVTEWRAETWVAETPLDLGDLMLAIGPGGHALGPRTPVYLEVIVGGDLVTDTIALGTVRIESTADGPRIVLIPTGDPYHTRELIDLGLAARQAVEDSGL